MLGTNLAESQGNAKRIVLVEKEWRKDQCRVKVETETMMMDSHTAANYGEIGNQLTFAWSLSLNPSHVVSKSDRKEGCY